ncbi:hypothetical protein Patl1_04786 [Pistacia atlantica]|uniref:Uncharacterized protein n=1 Tax=Pistacia atlantica TaxID=434234 RepID=A0ACC1BPV9_9ROSI|nr:hypothetical protein Patl1_04786 [Pistacia atlantica]
MLVDSNTGKTSIRLIRALGFLVCISMAT